MTDVRPSASGRDVAAQLLTVAGVTKAFGANRVLTDVSFTLRCGETLALVGENGAGKSTLVNILAGAMPYDAGAISFEGRPYRPASPAAARRQGVAIANQETAIAPDLTVGESVLFGSEPRRFGLIAQSELHRQAGALFEELGFAIAPRKMGRELSVAERHMAEIAKAVRRQPRLLILDEPTAALSTHEADLVMRLMAAFTARGGAVIFISHRLDEVLRCADRAIVLKDGAPTLNAPRNGFDRDALIRAMVGRTLSDIFPPRPGVLAAPHPRFEIIEASAPGLKPLTLALQPGEVLGVAGLAGQGQRPLARAVSGVAPFTAGKVRVDGEPVAIESVAAAIRHGRGMISEDRKREGLALDLSIRINTSIFALERVRRWGLLPLALDQLVAERARAQLSIRSTGVEQSVRELSGGNQQKVVFARWLEARPRMLVLHEPTKGVDIQTKSEIYAIVAALTAAGASVLLISSEMIELIGLSDRIAVLYRGAVTGIVQRPDFSEEAIMRLAAPADERQAERTPS
jgi:ABC-type sugar transport system ATPase subunit